MYHLTGAGTLFYRLICRPFWDSRVNALDCLCCVSILIHCITGLYYNNAAFILDSAASDLDKLLVAVNCITIIAVIGLFTITFTENQFRVSHTNVISKAMGGVISKLQLTLRTRCDVLLRHLNEEARNQSMDLGSEVAHPIFGLGKVRDKTEKPRTFTVTFQDGCTQFFATEEEVAELAITTGKANDAPLCEQFKAAAAAALEGTSITASNLTLEALFFVLLLVTCEEDSHTLLLSRRVRESIGQRDGISIHVVAPPVHKHRNTPRCFTSAFVGRRAG
jgi:hypothetical protein